ncbi:MAG: TonB-dependent receptor [Erythrobacter sp.]
MRIKTASLGAAVAALSWSAGAAAQDESAQEGADGAIEEADESDAGCCIPLIEFITRRILVTASRGNDVPVRNFNGSATFIAADDLENRQTRNIEDVLRDVPGVAVSSLPGQTQIRLRGSEANHVLILVDGIEVSDPFGGEFDLGTLQAEVGSRLEVIRGPQSALYGSDAIGGVVAYESGSYDGFGGLIEGGTNNTINGALRFGVSENDYEFSLSGVVVSTDGEPNARVETPGGGVRNLGRDSYTVSGKGSVEVADGFELRATARFIRTEGDFNGTDSDFASPTFGFVTDSPDTRFENQAFYALVGANFETLDGDWVHDLSAQVADINRDTFGAFGRTSGNEGDRLKASYVSGFKIDGGHSLTFAADWEREQFRNDDPFGVASATRQEIENVGLVGEYNYNRGPLDLSAAVRHDINDRFGDTTTFRVGAGYDVADTTRLRASAGSGIKNPGFFELFGFFDGVFIGNEDLTPEKNLSWEVGLDQTFANGDVSIALTYFNAVLDDEIVTTFPAPTFIATPINLDSESKQQGIEVALSANLGRGFSLNGAYTYLDAEEDGVEEVRRPDHIASASLNWESADDRFGTNLTVRYNGETEDVAFTDPSFLPVRETLDAFTLVNFNVRAEVTKGVTLFGRVENLLDERYEQVFSFVSPGLNAVAGIRAEF